MLNMRSTEGSGYRKHLVEVADGVGEVGVAQVGLQESQQRHQQPLQMGPSSLTASQHQLGHQVPA